MVTADHVSVSKPDPASYNLALQRLVEAFPKAGITAASCLAIEDTPAGIASATGAGISVVAVTNSYPAERLSKALKIVPSLEELPLSLMQTLV
jgi:beta-phosphoglucomutase